MATLPSCSRLEEGGRGERGSLLCVGNDDGDITFFFLVNMARGLFF